MECFLTGSRRYGPNYADRDSDVDLAILADEKTIDALLQIASPMNHDGDDHAGEEYGDTVMVFRFESLNVLVFCDEMEFNVWKNAALILESQKDVTRDKAVWLIKRMMSDLKYRKSHDPVVPGAELVDPPKSLIPLGQVPNPPVPPEITEEEFF